MRSGSLENPKSWEKLNSPAWRKVFAWLERALASPTLDGEYDIDCPGARIMVKTLATKSRDETVFEAHQRVADVHVCLGGSEWIDWAPAYTLTVRAAYNAEEDVTLYEPPVKLSPITMMPGTFAIFFPGEAHRPGITYRDVQTRKAIVKVPRELLR